MTSEAPKADRSSSSDRPSSMPWPPLLLAGLGGLAYVLGLLYPLGWPGQNDLPARIIGVGFGVVGLVLVGWAALELNRAKTTILPHQGADHLVTTGPFRRFRNPIYIADVLFLLCAAELTKNVWFAVAVAVFVPLVTWLAILPEERHLRRRFGEAYDAYVAKSRRWL
ncbi:MAG: isoprenylcysteine carboxylmethyltransferase family protein [Pseudomonadota bacterium]